MFKDMQIETTNHCNNACIYCPHKSMTRDKGFMSIEDIKIILDKAKAYGITKVYPFLTGEPTLHPQFEEIVVLIKSMGFICPIITNAGVKSLLPAYRLLGPEDSITVSLDTVNPDTYKKIRGQAIDNALMFTEELARNQSNVPISFQCIRTPLHQEGDEAGFIRYSMQNNVHYGCSDIVNWAGEIDSNVINGRDYCSRLASNVNILLNGDVCLCCVDYKPTHIVGNIFSEELSTIQERMKVFIDEFPKGICKGCNGRFA
jgi:hypothetical protein